MKIIKLKSENIKRLTAVEITPDGNLIKLSGKNSQGKTSILDSIFWALGGKEAVQGEPIRQGAKSGCITLDLGDIIVERRFTQKGSTLTVSNKDGAKFSSPQKMLDDLVGRLTFDPLAFMRMDPKKQAETLRDLCGLDFSEIDTQRKRAFDERTLVNRQVKDLTAQVNAIDVPEIAIDQEVDVAELAARITQANTHNQSIRDKQQALNDTRNKYKQVNELIEQLLKELEEANVTRQQLIDQGNQQSTELDSMEPIDISELQAQIDNAQALNEAFRKVQDAGRLTKQLETVEAEAERLTGLITQADESKARLISEAQLPVEGLGFSEDGDITYNELPIQQASGAEQLKISVAMAMALNPKLRVLRITDGSLLDSDSWKVIEQLATEGDYQVWAEAVDESGKVGIYIEDGHVAAVNGEPVVTEEPMAAVAAE